MEATANRPIGTTIDPEDVARFSAIASEWWDEKGKFAPLHRLNPARIGYLKEALIGHFHLDGQSATPLTNLSVLDIGCGGGLLTEPMARLGANMTGVDASETNINIARLHAEKSGLTIDYRTSAAESLAEAGEQYDAVFALEIIEHVADIELFLDAVTTLVKPGGLIVLSTLNRTAKSYAMGILGAEYILRWVPRGTHNWRQFVKPSELAEALLKRGFHVTDVAGLTLRLSDWKFTITRQDLDVNYLMAATRPATPSKF